MNTDRTKKIIRTSIVGIAVNAFLAVFKIIVGGIAGSIAIMLDGINNLSDAASSLITMIGAALAAKQPDRKHPYGYGRMEYLSSLVISAIVLYAGITAMIESVKKIINPETPDYSVIIIVIVIVAIVVKLALTLYTRKMGKITDSDALIASGKEAMMDVVLSISTVVAALIYVISGIGLEPYLGAVIAVIIIKAGLDSLKETISKIIGEPAEVQLAIDVKNAIKSFDEVNGAFDLVLNDYGPEKYIASVHAEVDEGMTAAELDRLTRKITDKVLTEYGVFLSAIGFYSKNRTNETVIQMQKTVAEIVTKREYIIGMHGFYVDFDQKDMRFDLVISLDAKDRTEVYKSAIEAVKEVYPDFEYHIGFDMDFNEIVNN